MNPIKKMTKLYVAIQSVPPVVLKHPSPGQLVLLLATLPFLFAGCSTRVSTFEVVDFREPGNAHTYREAFDEAFYDVDQTGNVNIVIFRER